MPRRRPSRALAAMAASDSARRRRRVLPLRDAARLDRAALRADADRQRAAARRRARRGGRADRARHRGVPARRRCSRDGGGFGAAQDSESWIDGARSEGGYYLRPVSERADLRAAGGRRQGHHGVERARDRRPRPGGRRARGDRRGCDAAASAAEYVLRVNRMRPARSSARRSTASRRLRSRPPPMSALLADGLFALAVGDR